MTMHSVPAELSQESLRVWLTAKVASLLCCPAEQIRPDAMLAEYGLDSVRAITLAAEIEDHFGLLVDVTVAWDHPSIEQLATFLGREQRAGAGT